MRAAVATGAKGKVTVKEVPTPQVQPGMLLLKTKYCSICGSDLEYLFNDLASQGKGMELYAGARLGHEFCAEVAAVGDGIEGWSVGDRAVPCYTTVAFGDPPVRGTLWDRIPGGFGGFIGAMAEYFLSAPNRIQKVPDSVSDEEATLVEPLGVGVGQVVAAGLTLGNSVVIIGAGKIGLSAVLCAKAAGVYPVIIIDLVKSRLDKARQMGADTVLNASEVDVISEVVKLTKAGPDVVIISSRAGRVLNQAVDMVRNHGKIMIAGTILPMEVDPLIWVTKGITIVASLGGPNINIMRTSLQLIANRQVNVKPLISEIMPLEDVQKAFDSMYSGENIVVLLKP